MLDSGIFGFSAVHVTSAPSCSRLGLMVRVVVVWCSPSEPVDSGVEKRCPSNVQLMTALGREPNALQDRIDSRSATNSCPTG